MSAANIEHRDLPFPMLYAEAVNVTTSTFDLAAGLARVRTVQPSGKRDQVLIVSSRSDRHADEVMVELMSRGVPVRRLNVDGFPDSLQFTVEFDNHPKPRALATFPGGEILLDEIRSVWMRRPVINLFHSGALGDAEAVASRTRNETALHGFLSLAADRFWVNSLRSLWAAQSKVGQLRVASALGLQIPRTLVTTDAGRAREFYQKCGGKVIVKVFRGQMGSPRTQFKMIYTSRVKPEHLEELDRVRNAPCIFQEEEPKDLELRITVIGRRVFPVEITSVAGALDWRDGTACAAYRPAKIPIQLEEACLKLLDHYGLVSAGIDMIKRPDGQHVFLELNAHHDWLWIEQSTGLPMSLAIADLLERNV